MGESASVVQVQSEVLGEGQEAPERRQFTAFLETGDGKIEDDYGQVGGYNTEEPFEIKFSVGQRRIAGHPAEELSPDEVAAEYEEEIHACPSETAYPGHMRRMSKDAVMVKEYNYDREGT